MIRFFRRHLAARLFISYLLIILVGVVVLSAVVEIVVPSAFSRHMAGMGPGMMGGMGQGFGPGGGSQMGDFYLNFRAAVNEALVLGTFAAIIMAILASLYISQRIVGPVEALKAASQRIAAGHYNERVPVTVTDQEDQDELDELALHFNQMAEQLEATENLRRQLIGDVAHELRTPLTTIKGSMEGLMDGVLPADDVTYQQVYREAERLQRLVEDLQELSLVEAGAFELKRQPVAIATLVNGLAARMHSQYEAKGVALVFDIPPDLPKVWVDEDRIGQVLLNLTGNALRYTPSAGRVTVWARSKEVELRIGITDTGSGIPQEHLPYVFDRFYRVDKSRSRPGRRLGHWADHRQAPGRSPWRSNLGRKRWGRQGK